MPHLGFNLHPPLLSLTVCGLCSVTVWYFPPLLLLLAVPEHELSPGVGLHSAVHAQISTLGSVNPFFPSFTSTGFSVLVCQTKI